MRATLASIGDGVITTDAGGIVTFLNPVAEFLTGWTRNEARGTSLTDVFRMIDEASREPIESPHLRALRENAIVRLTRPTLLVAKDGTERPIDDSAAPIRDAAGNILGIVLIFRDVSESRKEVHSLRQDAETERLEQAVWRKSEVQYRRLFESARDGILILDEKSGKIIDSNPYMSELLGFEFAHFLGKELWEIGLFKDIDANRAAFRELQAKGYLRYDHLPLETREGHKVDVEVVSNSYEAGGQLVIQCNIRDCSERVRLEKKIQASLEEKEVLLKEVHHRVKNNLQVISSLLHLQSLHTQDPASVQMFRDSQNRVRSMALIHERLYLSRDLTRVDFTDYIESLASHLFSALRVDADRIGLTVDVHGQELAIDAAIPCGLLLNELISNCLKHAFAGRERGKIRVELLPVDDSKLTLSVSDDGVGIAKGIDPRTAETFGMQLIADLVNQLHGSVQIVRGLGTAVRIEFPVGQAGVAKRIHLS